MASRALNRIPSEKRNRPCTFSRLATSRTLPKGIMQRDESAASPPKRIDGTKRRGHKRPRLASVLFVGHPRKGNFRLALLPPLSRRSAQTTWTQNTVLVRCHSRCGVESPPRPKPLRRAHPKVGAGLFTSYTLPQLANDADTTNPLPKETLRPSRSRVPRSLRPDGAPGIPCKTGSAGLGIGRPQKGDTICLRAVAANEALFSTAACPAAWPKLTMQRYARFEFPS